MLPLLDGLDEVAAPHRAACVEAINAYRQAHGLLPTVVCSRQTDYLVLSTRLLLRTAVVVQPLTPEQIESYLESGDERLEALRQGLQRDADLQALASTPLMLNVLTTAYQGTPPQEIVATGSPETKQEQIFATYVQRVLTHRSTVTHYTAEQTTHWLAWLARQMKQQNQTVFYLEHLQPDWLSGDRMPQTYDRWAVRFPAILMGMLVSLTINLVLFSPTPLPFSILAESTLLGGFVGWLLGAGRTTPQRHVGSARDRGGTWARLVGRLRVGGLIGLSYGLGATLNVGLEQGAGLRYWLVAGVINGLSVGLGSITLQPHFFSRRGEQARRDSLLFPLLQIRLEMCSNML